MTTTTRYPTSEYLSDAAQGPPFVRLELQPDFLPVDINLLFVSRQGWSPGDRLRISLAPPPSQSGRMGEILGKIPPHVLLRRYDRQLDSFISIRFLMDGRIVVESNDATFAKDYIRGTLLDCPPSFHTESEIHLRESWVNTTSDRAMFIGMLTGALGWDPAHQVPPAILESLEEARRAVDVANFRSAVVMCRRVVEALLKFAHERLLKAKPVDKNGKPLMLDGLIRRFREEKPGPLPAHLLHIADALRVVGNVPGAHPTDIPNYEFGASDAEFALGTAHYLVDQYFAKIDKEVGSYYVLTMDAEDKEPSQ
jgi:hypothetical protein